MPYEPCHRVRNIAALVRADTQKSASIEDLHMHYERRIARLDGADTEEISGESHAAAIQELRQDLLDAERGTLIALRMGDAPQ